MSSLKSKVIVVTGGTAGMGETFARRAASEGASVVIGARDKKRGEVVVAGIEAAGGSVRFVPTDVTEEDQVARLVETAVSEFGRLDGAFNNAAEAGWAKCRTSMPLSGRQRSTRT